MGQKHGEWLRRPCQNYRPLLIDACVESLASTCLPLSATLTCGKLQDKHLWDKSWQAENGHGSATHLGDQITALPDKLFFGTRREVDGEGDRATPGGETQTTPWSLEVFPGTSWNTCPWTEGTGRTLSVAYVPRWNNGIIKGFRSDQIRYPENTMTELTKKIQFFFLFNDTLSLISNFYTCGYTKRRNEFLAGTSICKCVSHSLTQV